jgi:hypothetical protein
VLPPAALAAGWAAWSSRKAGRGTGLTELLALAVPLALTWLPWPLRNLVNTGNPFYPGGYPLLGGADMSPEMYASILSMAHHPPPAQALEGLWRHPWAMFLQGPAELTREYSNGAYLGLLIPLFVPLLPFTRGRAPGVGRLLAAAAVVFVAWDLSFVQTRYFYPGAALLLVVAAASFGRVAAAVPRPFRLLLAMAVAAHLLFNACLGFRMVDTWTATPGFAFAGESDDAYLLRRMRLGQGAILDSYPVYRYANERLPREATVLVIGDAQHLYLRRRHRYAYLSATTPYGAFEEARDAVVAGRLAAEGVTHVVWNPGELDRLRGEGVVPVDDALAARMACFLAGPHARLLTATRAPALPVYLYEVSPAP